MNRKLKLISILLATLFSVAGCMTNPAPKLAEKTEQQALIDKVAKLESELAEWHEMKGALSRLIVIEGDLKLLVEQLNMIAASSQKTPQSPAVAETKADKTKVDKVNALPEAQPQLANVDTPAATSAKATATKQNVVKNSATKATEATDAHSGVTLAKAQPSQKIDDTANQVKVPESLAMPAYASAYPSAPQQPIETDTKVLKSANARSASTSVTKATTPANARYSLQLSSVVSYGLLEPAWLELRAKHSQQLAPFEPRYEQVVVKGKNYYRIKVGMFSQRDKAQSVCKQMKQSGLDCIMATTKGINLYNARL
ncbi:SPOR domain-containing protein [Shewanella youngdeokensis]|uniref:SPOR domain-containing protein n=1 Tax=Shewanella youngdeokensis TaxID=2999068 RepID=A0ABZ0JZK7_9GAMM|nr:SPOR domain-containing protein [Shewanella sp. DAU334]